MKKKQILAWFLRALIVGIGAYGLYCAKGKDFYSYLDVAEGFRALKDNIYVEGSLSGMQNHYPPAFAMLMMPLTFLPPLAAGYLWFLLKISMLILAVRAIPGLLADAGLKKKMPTAVWWLGGLLVARFVVDDFKLGQINLLLSCLLILFLALEQKGKFVWAGLLLGLCVTVKVYPAIFLVGLFFRGRWKAFGWTLVSLAVLNLLPWAFYQERYLQLLHYFNQESIAGAAAAPNSGVANQSLYGMCMRYLGANTCDSEWVGLVNLFAWSFETVRAVYMGIAALVLGATVWAARRKPELFGWNLMFIAALVVPMVARKANFTLLLLPGMTAAALVMQGRMSRIWKSVFWLSFLFLGFTADGLITRRFSDWAQALSLLTLGAFGLAAIQMKALLGFTARGRRLAK